MQGRCVQEIIKESIRVKEKIQADTRIVQTIAEAAQTLVQCFQNGGKVLLCGNGGSAADAQHIAAELSGRFMLNRPPLFAEALHVNTSYLTATANDYAFDQVYSRLIEAKGRPDDVLIALSTSGNSPNVVLAAKIARKMKMITIGLTGIRKARLDPYCAVLIKVPSDNTARIQEAHILIGHIICELVEQKLFGK